MAQFKIFLFIIIISIKNYAFADLEAEPVKQVQVKVSKASCVAHRVPLTTDEKREIYNYHLFAAPDIEAESLEEVRAKAGMVRDIVHNLDHTDAEELRISNAYLYDFIKDNEEFNPYARDYYHDEFFGQQPDKVLKKRLIGYGFNMNRPQARTEWDAAFKGKLSFDAAIKSEIRLTKDQAHQLLVSRITQCQKELAEIYKPYWERIKPNEQHALVDIYYVSGTKYVGKGTEIYKNMIKYYQTSDPKFLNKAREVIRSLPE